MAGGVVRYGEHYLHVIKGSPEVIASYCSQAIDEKLIEEWAQKGYRLIAMAYKLCDEPKLSLKANFVWGGLVALQDPIRPEVPSAIATAKSAGVAIVMITGDHPATALGVAKELGIAFDRNEVMSSAQLERASQEEILSKKVFARITPSQKLKIVQTYQKAGEIVAVTGDGVNDAPALKFAHIGIAMGSGSDVAKESAKIIVTDDSFGSIVSGIEEGRRAYDNIRKVVHLLISTGFAELLLVTLSIAFSTPVPLLPTHLLWLNLVTNGIQDVALGLEPAEPDTMRRPPRDPKEPIFDPVMLRRIAIGGSYMALGAFGSYYYLLWSGWSVEAARNAVLFLMVLFENAHVFNSRSERLPLHRLNHLKNPLLILSVFAAQGVHIGAMHLPLAQQILQIGPIDVALLPYFFLLALGLVVTMELEKLLRRRFSKSTRSSRTTFVKGKK
jgi:magnesium-transporting ATPase (P-type)